MANHRILKRDPEWWREDGELSEEQKEKRMSEEVSSPKSLKEAKVTLKLVEKPSKPYEGPKAGSDGKNVPSVTTMYARKKASEAMKPVAKRVVEADEDEIEDEEIEDDDFISDNEYEDDMNPESDVAPEFEDEGDVEIGQSTCRCPACGATLILEPVEEDEEEELAVAEDDLEDESEEEGEEGEVPLDMDVESEDQDIEKAKLESSRRKLFKKYIEARKNFRNLEKALKEMDDSDQDIDPEMAFDNGIDSEYVESAKNKRKRQMELARKRILARKRKAEGNSELGVPYGSESSDMVTPGKTSSGTKTMDDGNTDDFGEMGDDKSFANSSSPVMERRKALKKKIEQHRRKVSEEGVVDPYELEDTEQKQIGDEFADLPIEMGNDPDAISQYESIRQRRKNRQKEGIETEEKLDFKKLISK